MHGSYISTQICRVAYLIDVQFHACKLNTTSIFTLPSLFAWLCYYHLYFFSQFCKQGLSFIFIYFYSSFECKNGSLESYEEIWIEFGLIERQYYECFQYKLEGLILWLIISEYYDYQRPNCANVSKSLHDRHTTSIIKMTTPCCKFLFNNNQQRQRMIYVKWLNLIKSSVKNY